MKFAPVALGLLGTLLIGGCCCTKGSKKPSVEALFKQADKSGDGKVSREEYEDFMIADMFSLYDDDGDGVITEEEFVADGGTPETFKKLNVSGTGKLSMKEAMGSKLIRDHLAAPFDEADVDGSGYVTWEEFQVALEKRRSYVR